MLIQLNSKVSVNPEFVREVAIFREGVTIFFKNFSATEVRISVNDGVPKDEILTVTQVTQLLNGRTFYSPPRQPAFPQDKTPQDAPRG